MELIHTLNNIMAGVIQDRDLNKNTFLIPDKDIPKTHYIQYIQPSYKFAPVVKLDDIPSVLKHSFQTKWTPSTKYVSVSAFPVALLSNMTRPQIKDFLNNYVDTTINELYSKLGYTKNVLTSGTCFLSFNLPNKVEEFFTFNKDSQTFEVVGISDCIPLFTKG